MSLALMPAHRTHSRSGGTDAYLALESRRPLMPSPEAFSDASRLNLPLQVRRRSQREGGFPAVRPRPMQGSRSPFRRTEQKSAMTRGCCLT